MVDVTSDMTLLYTNEWGSSSFPVRAVSGTSVLLGLIKAADPIGCFGYAASVLGGTQCYFCCPVLVYFTLQMS